MVLPNNRKPTNTTSLEEQFQDLSKGLDGVGSIIKGEIDGLSSNSDPLSREFLECLNRINIKYIRTVRAASIIKAQLDLTGIPQDSRINLAELVEAGG